MLDFMRKHAQSWMIKAALGAVVVVFIFWGIWTPHEGSQRELVKIGNQIITVAEARNYYQNMRDRYQAMYGERFTEEMAKKLNLKERAVKDLVSRVLLVQEARRLGLKVTEGELEASIHANPAFQKDGLFDQATYTRALQRVRLTPKDFEAGQKEGLLINKLQGFILSSVRVSDQEILDAYRHGFENVNLEVISLNPGETKDLALTPEEVKEYFSKHKDDFKLPAKVKVRYLLFDPQAFMKQIFVSAKEIEDYYENNKEKFSQPKQVKVRHILIKAEAKDKEGAAKARQKAESIRGEAAKGKDFAQLAKQHSEDPGTKDRGGEIGLISKGMVVPEFEQAAFSMKAGDISDVIQTQFGFHILKVDEVQEASTQSLEKAKPQIEALLKNRQARGMAYDLADQAFERASKDKSLDKFAEEKKMPVKESPLFSSEDKLDLDPKLKASALSMGKGDISPTLRVGETFAVLHAVEKEEARVPELKEVEGRVTEALRKEKQKEKALARAKDILEKLKKGADFKQLAAQEGLKVVETGFFPRASAPPKVSPSEDLRKALAALTLKNPYPEAPIFQDGKYSIYRLKELKAIDLEQFNTQKENYRRGLLMQKQEMVLNQWLEDLLEKAKARGDYKELQPVNEAI
ncbi:MAG: SurA N-terminal domain-containing protein [Syntrophaceae bacterium]|nr:SurA N-terminal domain-containing protein [Syntrophaceae bacterium]